MATYELTPHTLRMRSNTAAPKISRYDIFDSDPDSPAFVLHNVLSVEECQYLIQQAEAKEFDRIGSRNGWRCTDRFCASSETVAATLFDRIRPFLPDAVRIDDDDDATARPTGIPRHFPKGEWVPHGLNEVFRICRYQVGGHFRPHHDGGYQRSHDEQSIQTFMLYLNDDFQGGSTNFYQESQLHYRDVDPDKVVYSFRPTAGDALIFNSKMTHDGGDVISGKKYIMRSEVMYRRTSKQVVEENERYIEQLTTWAI